MCYKVECSKCGKFTWNGCGKHVASVYEGIEKGKHCSCKPWPGVDTKAEGSTSAAKEGETPLLNFSSDVKFQYHRQLTSLLNFDCRDGLQVKRKLEFDGGDPLVFPLFD
jgi:hypothetical protein